MSLFEWVMNPSWRRRWYLIKMLLGVIMFILGLIGLYNLFTKGWMW